MWDSSLSLQPDYYRAQTNEIWGMLLKSAVQCKNTVCANIKHNRYFGVLLEYPTTTGFQWGHLKNGPYTYTVSGGNGRVF